MLAPHNIECMVHSVDNSGHILEDLTHLISTYQEQQKTNLPGWNSGKKNTSVLHETAMNSILY